MLVFHFPFLPIHKQLSPPGKCLLKCSAQADWVEASEKLCASVARRS